MCALKKGEKQDQVLKNISNEMGVCAVQWESSLESQITRQRLTTSSDQLPQSVAVESTLIILSDHLKCKL